MRKITGNKTDGEKFWLKAGAGLFLLGFLLFNALEISAQWDPCGISQHYPVSTNTAPMRDANNNLYGYGKFNILRNGDKNIGVNIAFAEPLPQETILAVQLNGIQLGVLNRFFHDGQEHWSWATAADEPSEIAKVGAVMTITRNGQPFLSGTFARHIYNWAYVLGSVAHDSPQGFPPLCSGTYGNVYLSNSPYPRRLSLRTTAWTTSPVTRVTLNGPTIVPGTIGAFVAELPLLPPGGSIPPPPGWMVRGAANPEINLTPFNYDMLRSGHLAINVFTESHPTTGFSQMFLDVYYVNAGGDYEGDGQADFAVFRPSDQTWYLYYSSNNQFQAVPFGLPTDKLVVGDFEHDGKTDITAFQIDNPDYPGLGVWQIRKSSDNSTLTIQWGLNDDIPLAMDIDGNNTSDLAVFRPSNGTWYIRKMGDIIKPRNRENETNYRIIQWGAAGDKPLAGDFDADGIDELVVFRPSNGDWYIYNDVTESYQIHHWGMNGDIPMARDFDGDARADLAVFRPANGTWYIRSSLDNSLIARQFGISTDIPVPADFDKDGVTDIAVFRPSDGTWYIIRSSDNSFVASQFGADGDIPAMGQR